MTYQPHQTEDATTKPVAAGETMQSDRELLECPFCGAPDQQDMNITDSMPGTAGKRHAVYCSACNAEGPTRYNAADARSAWNSRSSLSAAAAPGQGWQPIETAPKDGTHVLVWPPLWTGTASCAAWNKDEYNKRPRPFWSRTDDMGRTTRSRENQPTHWMPISVAPPAPAAGEGETPA